MQEYYNQMQQGKLSHNVLKRSVLKYIVPRRPEILLGAGMGNDSSAISIGEDGVFFMSTNVVNMTGEEGIYCCFHRTLNDLAVVGAEPVAVLPNILLPEAAEESLLQNYMRQLNVLCEQYQLEIGGGHTAVSAHVTEPVISMTMVGMGEKLLDTKAYAGQDLILTKTVGMEGTGLIARQKKEELCTHYTLAFVEQAEDFLQNISVMQEAKLLVEAGVSAMHNVSEGGILTALWEFMERSNTGMEVELKAIPVRQETIELCEFYRLNPYQLMSNGSLLFAAQDGNAIVRRLEEKGISASVIGRVTDQKQRILRNEEETRYLDRPKPDELVSLKIM
ncbi:MAG: AIR synthase family protein [Lachnospiraceae bacterium]